MEIVNTQNKVGLASDNCTAAHPLVLQALVEANVGYAPSYGADPWTDKAAKLIQETLRVKSPIFFVPTGTGGNILGLVLLCRRHESVICTDIAHINYQESGASEAIIGCKLLTVPHENGKITQEAVEKKLRSERAFGKHSTSPRVLAITQPTEVGTVYTLPELRALAQLCEREKLLLHMDGSRIYNAAASLNVNLGEMVKAASVSTLALGGTKNGLVGAEALVVCHEAAGMNADYMQKQTLQLLSKMRYLSAQYIPFFTKELWRDLATLANLRAQEIAAIIKATPGVSLSYPVETNQLFFTVPSAWIPLIQDEIYCMLWDQEINQLRFIASWDTSENDVKRVQSIFARIARQMS
ncbi:MAG TPA: aminotransferase class I/II-fold pyridoxal phosphate-dependent enzyme [Myxococcota bacterium]|nr:aminotransferase class I/II-fold pyridoxal phosphate-dependent enzyme [Myxococcota bacterium]